VRRRQGQGQAGQDGHPTSTGRSRGSSASNRIPAVSPSSTASRSSGFLGALPEGQVTAFVEQPHQDRIGGEKRTCSRARTRRWPRRRRASRRISTGKSWRRIRPACPALGGLGARLCGERRARGGQADARSGAGAKAQRSGGGGGARRARIGRAGKSVGPIGELEAKVAADPLDHQARFDLGRVAMNGAGRRKEAVDNLIAIVRRDRKWNDDGARKQLVQFFEAWGPTDEATVDGRSGCPRSCSREPAR